MKGKTEREEGQKTGRTKREERQKERTYRKKGRTEREEGQKERKDRMRGHTEKKYRKRGLLWNWSRCKGSRARKGGCYT